MADQKLTVSLILNSTSFTKQIQEVNRTIKLNESEFKKLTSSVTDFSSTVQGSQAKISLISKNLSEASKKTDIYRSAIKETETELNTLTKRYDDVNESIRLNEVRYNAICMTMGENSDRAKELKKEIGDLTEEKGKLEGRIVSVNGKLTGLQTDLNKSEASVNGFKTELEQANKDLENFNVAKAKKQLEDLSKSFKDTGDGLKKAGKNMKDVGGKLTRNVTLPIVAMGTAAIGAQVSWESAFAGVKKTVNGTVEQIAALEEGIKDMSLTLPTSANDIAAVAEAAGQLGIETESILDFTKVIIDLSNATNLVGEDGAAQLAKFANITGMAQTEFDRLGSTIVDLGNNSATTEADIVNMAMRLAGAGTQVGMTEAQILGLSAALSSVGIEAEAGGSAFSKVMVNMQLAVETGNESLQDFASIAGMSAEEFSTAFKDDATVALLAFIDGLGKAEESGSSAIKVLDDMDIKEVRLRDSLLRASSASELFNDTINLGTQAWEENTALTNEANQRYATTESQMLTLKNEIVDLAREIGIQLLPMVKDAMEVFKDLLDKFNKLSPETKKNTLMFLGFSAILGPVVKLIGTLTSGTGSLVGGLGKLAGKLATSTTATSALGAATSGVATSAAGAAGASGLGALATSLGGVATAALPWVAAGAAVVGTGVAIHKNMSEEVIPTVDLFASETTRVADAVYDANGRIVTSAQYMTTTISEGTASAVQSYLDMDEGVRNTLYGMYINSEIITTDTVTNMTTKFAEMGTAIKTGMQTDCDEQVGIMTTFFETSSALTEEQEAAILAKNQEYYDKKKSEITGYEEQIATILEGAAASNRELTQHEADMITAIQNKMREESVTALSEQEAEANLILERMKSYDGRITGEMASEHIKNLNKQRDEAIKSTEQEFDERLRTIIQMRDETGSISAEQANRMIDEATRQRDETIKAAEETRDGAVDKIFTMNKELVDDVDTSTGDIVSKWDKLFGKWDKWSPKKKTVEVETNERINRYVKNASSSTNEPISLSGYSDSLLPYTNDIARLSRETLDTVYVPPINKVSRYINNKSSAANVGSVETTSSSNTDMIEALQTQNSLLYQVVSLLSKDKDVNISLDIDGRQVAKATAKYMDEEISSINKRKSRLGGFI